MKEKLLILGASHNKGTSKKTGNDYSMLRLFSVKPAQNFAEEGSSVGLEGDAYQISDEAYTQLLKLNLDYPAHCYVSFSVNSRKQVTVSNVEKA